MGVGGMKGRRECEGGEVGGRCERWEGEVRKKGRDGNVGGSQKDVYAFCSLCQNKIYYFK